jgi:hypothetical protein
VSALDRCSEPGPETGSCCELHTGLPRHGAVELWPTDQAEPDEGLTDALARHSLSPQRLVDPGWADCSVRHQDLAQQGRAYVVFVHVTPPKTDAVRMLRAAPSRMT